MLATAQIVSSAEIIIDDKTFSSIGSGCLLFVCIEESDSFEKVKDFFYSSEYQAAHEILKDTVVRNHQIIEGS